MENGEIPATPDTAELLQIETGPPIAVPVRFEQPLTVHRLPNRRAQYADTAVAFGKGAVEILPANPKRGAAQLIFSGGAGKINTHSMGGGMTWPANVPYPITHTQDVWVEAATVDIVVGSVQELWSD